MKTEPTQANFSKACEAATARLFMHRHNLSRVGVRIGYWPDGMVISANITARDDEELKASRPPHVIPWEQLATISEARMIEIVDELCNPLYQALGVKPADVRETP